MKKITSVSLAVFIFLCMVIATEHQAFGYVDPGSGLLALQSLASVAAASAYFLRRRLGRLFGSTVSADKPLSTTKEGNTIKAA